jgi:hypothetical protein
MRSAKKCKKSTLHYISSYHFRQIEYLEIVEDSKEYQVRNNWGKPRKVEFPCAHGVLE